MNPVKHTQILLESSTKSPVSSNTLSAVETGIKLGTCAGSDNVPACIVNKTGDILIDKGFKSVTHGNVIGGSLTMASGGVLKGCANDIKGHPHHEVWDSVEKTVHPSFQNNLPSTQPKSLSKEFTKQTVQSNKQSVQSKSVGTPATKPSNTNSIQSEKKSTTVQAPTTIQTTTAPTGPTLTQAQQAKQNHDISRGFSTTVQAPIAIQTTSTSSGPTLSQAQQARQSRDISRGDSGSSSSGGGWTQGISNDWGGSRGRR